MKLFRLIFILSASIIIGYFSWDCYTSRSLHEKHERATLVFQKDGARAYCMERIP